MALDRSVFSVFVDDDGSGTTGTILTKAAYASAFLDPVDAEIARLDADIAGAGGGAFTEQTTTATGAQNNFNLTAHLTYLRCTGAAPVFTGFTVLSSAPAAGDRVIIACLGTTARVADQDTGSTAAYRAIHPSVRGQIVGVNGSIEYAYDDTTDRWRMVRVEPGKPIAIAHAGLTFFSGTGTWTVDSGDLNHFYYVQSGKLVTYSISVVTSSCAGCDADLKIAESSLLPGGFTCSNARELDPARIMNNGTFEVGWVLWNGTNALVFQRASLAAHTDSTNNTAVIGAVTMEMN